MSFLLLPLTFLYDEQITKLYEQKKPTWVYRSSPEN